MKIAIVLESNKSLIYNFSQWEEYPNNIFHPILQLYGCCCYFIIVVEQKVKFVDHKFSVFCKCVI